MAAALAGASLVAASAYAYVRSTMEDGMTPVSWPGSCAWLQIDSAGTPDMPLSDLQSVVAHAIFNWQSVTIDKGCSYFRISQDAPAAVEAHFDYKNVLKFRNDVWCHPLEPDQDPKMPTCYSPSAAAITTVFYAKDPKMVPGPGTILDADIEVNNLNFTFDIEPSTADPRPGTVMADLENTLTHELGHFQGLGHTCWTYQISPKTGKPVPPQPTDDMGNLVPSCDDVASHTLPISEFYKITQATMYNYADAREISKRTPKADDIAGICAIYAAANDPKTCMRAQAPKTPGGCAIGGRQSSLAAVFAMGGVGILLGVRRRRRR